MPYLFELDSIHSIARARFEGHITGRELTHFYREAREAAARLDLRGGVIDLSAVTSVEVSLQTIRALAKLRPALADPDRPRVIIAPATHIFGLARLFESEGQGTRPNLHVVHSQREAWAILGVMDPQFAPRAKEAAAGTSQESAVAGSKESTVKQSNR